MVNRNKYWVLGFLFLFFSATLANAQGLQGFQLRQPVDHFGHFGQATFSQRYWIDSSFATGPAAPILLHICGESAADQGYYLNDSTLDHAKALGAHVVYLEHRYYGQSQPFADLSTSHLQFLTLDNVLEDLAFFEKELQQKMHWTGRWIAIGGSYSGTLAALFRERHPELVVGALAASAPMFYTTMPDEGSGDDVSSIDPASYPNVGDRQWSYEACTKFGFWLSIGNQLVQPSARYCQRYFPQVPLFDGKTYNQKYYLPFVTEGGVTHVLFTNGSEDSWAQISIQAQENHNSGNYTLMIQGAGHHFDLNPADPNQDTAEVLNARQKFQELARAWLSE
jgi:pimeloyl-ACP methyl ester carboxylesterase